MEHGYQNGILSAFVELPEVKLGQFAIISPIWPILGFWGKKLGVNFPNLMTLHGMLYDIILLWGKIMQTD